MQNAFDEMQRALQEAADVQRAADANANRMASLLRGRLRHVGRYQLKALKRELRDFNITTGEWKE